MSVPFGTMVLGLFMKPLSLEIISYRGIIKLLISLIFLFIASELVAKGVSLMSKGVNDDI
ncbi:MAG: hypothetical protein MK033_04560 [Candidatus Caenarcaniphilales bacterium]|nr:hypothetical protein [Candidatus Caenarcaniphilales bacterium]